MTPLADPPKRDRWARLRFAIIGPLMAAPPAPRSLYTTLQSLASKTWRHPDSGLDLRFAVSTLERWYYAARRASDPVGALRNRLRANEGRFPSLSPVAVAVLTSQYREHPSWTAQLHLDNLRVACQASQAHDGQANPADGSRQAQGLASYSTVRRFLLANGMHRQARARHVDGRATEGAIAARDRLERLEVRSFEVEHVGALWHLDFHHGSRRVLTRAGQWITSPCCWASSMTARAWCATCSGTLTRPPRAWCTACRRPS